MVEKENLTEAEKVLIEEIRRDPLLKKAVFGYFEAEAGINLPPD